MVVSDIDLRLLRVFRAVVEAGGFSNAQAILNVSQSTISTQMSQLEARLGITLCHRGRAGFKLTDEGERCYRQVLELFQALQTFQNQADALRGCLGGVLRVGFLDNVITDPACPLREALRCFSRRPDNQVRLALDVLSPQEMERRLVDRSLDAAVGIFFSQLPGLAYRPLHLERDTLVCARSHPLARVTDPLVLGESVPRARKVVRSFLGTAEFPYAAGDGDARIATVSNVEAAAHLILTGEYLGFLPRHYSRAWVERGEMVELLPAEFVRDSRFHLATRADAPRRNAGLAAFLDCMQAVTGGHAAVAAASPDPFDLAEANVER